MLFAFEKLPHRNKQACFNLFLLYIYFGRSAHTKPEHRHDRLCMLESSQTQIWSGKFLVFMIKYSTSSYCISANHKQITCWFSHKVLDNTKNTSQTHTGSSYSFYFRKLHAFHKFDLTPLVNCCLIVKKWNSMF